MTIDIDPSPPELLQDMCDSIANEIHAIVSFMGNGGRIIASSSRERIGGIHDGAARIMRGEIDEYGVTAQEAAQSNVMREGYNLAIDYEGQRLWSLAIAASLDTARLFARLARNWVLSHLKAERESKKRAAAISASEDRFRDFAEIASDWFWETDRNLRWTYFSERFQEVTGIAPADLIGKTRREVGIGSIDPESWNRHLDDLEHRRGFRNFEYFIRNSKGDVRFLRISARPISDQTGKFAGYRGIGTDVSDRHRAEEEIRARTRELRESLRQQTATADMLRIISRSSFDLQTVLNTLVQSVAQLCEADSSSLFRCHGTEFHWSASYGFSQEYNDYIKDYAENRHVAAGRGTLVGRVALECAIVQIPDVIADSEYTWFEGQAIAGFRTMLGVPLLRRGSMIGALEVTRSTVRPFTDQQIELATNFADQAVIAIENVRLFDEIQDKSRQLAEASKHKSQFLANMSHELRTPLNAIIGVTEMLHEDARDLKREYELEPLERVLRAAKHLLALINGILDLSKIEAGKMDIHIDSFAIAPLIEDVVQTIGMMAAKNGNEVVVNCAADIGTMRSDQTRIRQTLLNLASNANKFTERGTVTIGAKRVIEEGREWVTIAVTDTGIGLTPEQMGKLFQDFVQADTSTTRKYGGTGLGLAISRRFCQMMGGDIMIASEPGRGSTFTIRLPTEVGIAQLAAAVRDAAGPRPRVPPSAGSMILVVDDDQSVLDLTERFLTREGFSVLTASGGQEGLRLAREFHPAAITLDVMMPDLDGWTVLAAIKGDPELADIPVILMTIVDEKNRGYSLGATDYMVKPVDRERLSGVLRNICGAVGRQVFLVDDDDMMRRGMRLALEQDGWQVSEAENGRIALARLAETRPDIIMLDLMMPEMDGFEFLVEMRRQAEWRDIPVLVVTAKNLTVAERSRLNDDVARVLQKGASGLDELLREIGRILPGLIERGRDKKSVEETG